ncbi:Selenoprotein o, partial [Globisporangium splendens]
MTTNSQSLSSLPNSLQTPPFPSRILVYPLLVSFNNPFKQNISILCARQCWVGHLFHIRIRRRASLPNERLMPILQAALKTTRRHLLPTTAVACFSISSNPSMAHSSSTNASLYRGVWRMSTPAPSRFDNAVLRELPIDPEPQNYVRSAVPGACFSRVSPTPIVKPELVIVARDAIRHAGIEVYRRESDVDDESAKHELVPIDELVPFLAGNEIFPGSETAAQCYCGHQFGYFSGQLGDGAAIYLGEVINNDNERWEVQLKGAGLTPYSRTADGRKVLRSTLREFLASEHMHALGVPTTRAGSVVVSRDTTVVRDMFYDGNPKREPTAVVMRIAKSFLRFGSFEIFKEKDPQTGRAGPSAHLPSKADMMRQMLDFTIKQYFPDVWAAPDASQEAKYVRFFEEVVQRTARLVAKWQSIGFCHGVLNTDNMSIVGDTLDYGPYGFMEHFNPEHICNTSDDSGRYRYESQPDICKWNLSVFADQLALVLDRKDLEPVLETYNDTFSQELSRLLRAKLGLSQKSFPSEDRALTDALFDVLTETGSDFTCTFRALADIQPFDESSHTVVLDQLVEFSETLEQVKRRVSSFTDAQYEMVRLLLRENPMQARMYGITDENFKQMTAERELRKKLDESTDVDHRDSVRAAWTKWIDKYVNRLKEETDCTPDAEKDVQRRVQMQQTNPKFILRNHVAQKAIDFAADGDYIGVQQIFNLLTHPFDEGSEDDLVYARPEDSSVAPLCVSCSS